MLRFFKRNYRFKNSFPQGFSVVELLVTISIVTTILTVIVMNQSKYVDSLVLGNLADELSLSIAQAQAYGIAVKELSPGSNNFSVSYGVTASVLSTTDTSAYLFFTDTNGNGSYDGTWTCTIGGASECVEKKNFSRGNYTYEVCAVRTIGTDECSNIGRVDITFIRPDIGARLVFYNSAGNLYTPPNLKGARITLKNPVGNSRSVIVYQSGQISVQ